MAAPGDLVGLETHITLAGREWLAGRMAYFETGAACGGPVDKVVLGGPGMSGLPLAHTGLAVGRYVLDTGTS